jgi:quercetin dioxygenase-like cupin family protein
MIIPNIHVDEHNHSYFGESELVQNGNPERRIGAKNQNVEYWQMRRLEPGYFNDFKSNESAQFVGVISGQVALTVSNGETRQFARGDMFMLKDRQGQGHATRAVGHEPCVMLVITLPGEGDFI